MSEPAYTSRRLLSLPLVTAVVIALAMMLAAIYPASGQGAPFSGGGKAGTAGAYGEPSYNAAPAYVANASLYVYGTAADGKGYWTTYDGAAWTEYQSWDAQPVNYKWRPTATEYGGKQYVYYAGEDNKYYQNTYDGSAWSGWEDTSGAYTYAAAPYVGKTDTAIYLYGVATDGNLYHKGYDGTAWGEWTAVNDPAYPVGAYQPYSVYWGGYENVFWTGQDGKAYWNRYDGTAWTGAKEIPGDYTYAAAPYAVGYNDTLYAYTSGADGVPYYNTFDGSAWAGWSGYQAAPAAPVAAYAPNAYVYENKQHVVYTGQDGHGYYTSYDGTTWTPWTDLGANYAYEPVQYEYGGGYYLAYTGQDGGLYYKTYSGGGTIEETPTPSY
jgi:hypothetical protein